MTRVLFGLALLTLLSACVRRDEATLDAVSSAQSGLRVSMQFAGLPSGETRNPIPGALAGVISGSLLMEVGLRPLPPKDGDDDERPQAEEDTLLLQHILDLLMTDVQGLLNRSLNRDEALAEHVADIEFATEEGRSRLRDLGDREEDLEDDERRLRSGVNDLQDELRDALASGEPVGATLLIQDIVARQSELAAVQTDLLVTSELARSFEDALIPLEERLEAILANRDALLAGVKVVDLPGVEELGVLEVIGGRARLRRR